MKSISASAPGNLFFFGEHAVVYEKPAIIAAVGKRTEVTVNVRKDGNITINSDAFGAGTAKMESEGKRVVERRGPAELDVLFDLCEMIMQKEAGNISSGFEVRIKSDIPIKSGMSSSTAVFGAMLAAITEANGIHIKKEDYFEYLLPLQRIVHGGKASGSEIISSAVGGFNLVQKGKWRQLREDLPLSIVVADTKVASPTYLTVGYHVPSLIDRNADLVWNAFDLVESITRRGERAIQEGDIETVGRLMNENQEILKSLGLSHPKLDDCIEEALRAGALGAKLSGSGWGGVCFALTYPTNQGKVAKAMSRTRADVIQTEMGVHGVTIEKMQG